MKISKFTYACILAAGNAADAVITLLALSAGHIEANPLMAGLIDFSPITFLIIKLFFSMLVFVLHEHITSWILKFGACLYVLVFIWNLMILQWGIL